MNINAKQKNLAKKLGLALCFFAAIMVITNVALRLGTIANATTVGFTFLVIVVLSAVFAGLAVAILTSVAATLFFNYFFFPPIGTFVIHDPANWIALFAFLFTAIVISRLTASAHENARQAEALRTSHAQIKEFSDWLFSEPLDRVTLSGIAANAVRIFSLGYCSIHVYAEGKWHHFSGTAFGPLFQQVSDLLKANQDHPTSIIELAEEQSLGVQYSQIRTGPESFAMVAVKGDLSTETFKTVTSMIGLLLIQVLRETDLQRS